MTYDGLTPNDISGNFQVTDKVPKLQLNHPSFARVVARSRDLCHLVVKLKLDGFKAVFSSSPKSNMFNIVTGL